MASDSPDNSSLLDRVTGCGGISTVFARCCQFPQAPCTLTSAKGSNYQDLPFGLGGALASGAGEIAQGGVVVQQSHLCQ